MQAGLEINSELQVLVKLFVEWLGEKSSSISKSLLVDKE